MEKTIKQIIAFLDQGIETIFKFLTQVWTWSFGQIITIFQSDWQSLAFWKLVILCLVSLIIFYFLFSAARQVWGATEAVFKSFVGLLSAFVSVLPQIVTAGLIAFAGGYVIQNINF